MEEKIMKAIKTELDGVLIIEPDVFGDHRGWFMESWSKKKYEELGINVDFVQDNQSFTAKKGTLRGLHFQMDPMAQSKLVRVVKGAVLDVAVDIRKNSPTYLKWVSVELSAENKRQFFIPQGFAHGFVTLTDDVEFVYKCDNYYSKECDRSIKFDDPAIGVEWGIDDPIISQKDQDAPLVKDSDCNFIYKGE
jgi:dTDP-4-dehydrorhamnose 3,5-epimerase